MSDCDFENGPGNTTELIVEIFAELVFALPRPFEFPYSYIKRIRKGRVLTKKQYYETVMRLKKRGSVKITSAKGKKFVELTKKGSLEMLFNKAKKRLSKQWDGNWRLFMFDIPESSKSQREKIRSLLKQIGFKKLQASVYISPYELNREAVLYLDQSGLKDFIRIALITEMDNEKDLLKAFNLTRLVG